MSLLELDDVRVSYRTDHGLVHVVDGVGLTVEAGTTVGLVGESGSGKSTLAKAIVGLAPVTRGEVRHRGVSVTRARGPRLRRLRERVQMVFQDPYASLNPRLTVGQLVEEPLREHTRLGRAERRREVARLLGLVHLDEAVAARYPFQFSGGQRQRIAIARALAVSPELVIADEITSALDVSVQATILNLLRELQRETGIAFLFISHNLAVVRYLADSVAVMHRGRVVEDGPARELFAAPRDPYTQALVAAVPRLRR